jgi:hypothetical protein
MDSAVYIAAAAAASASAAGVQPDVLPAQRLQHDAIV